MDPFIQTLPSQISLINRYDDKLLYTENLRFIIMARQQGEENWKIIPTKL
jgi:hypothetical protein